MDESPYNSTIIPVTSRWGREWSFCDASRCIQTNHQFKAFFKCILYKLRLPSCKWSSCFINTMNTKVISVPPNQPNRPTDPTVCGCLWCFQVRFPDLKYQLVHWPASTEDLVVVFNNDKNPAMTGNGTYYTYFLIVMIRGWFIIVLPTLAR